MLRPALGGLWTSIRVVSSTGSTNADLLALAARGSAGTGGTGSAGGTGTSGTEGQVLIAEEQTAGRGRLGRSWSSQPGGSITFSVLLRPVSVPPVRRGWLPLLTGVAVTAAVRSVAGVAATLKWPNDVLAGDRKLAGILAEQSPDGSAVVVGVGINVTASRNALPVSATGLAGTSLLAEGASVAREALLIEILGNLEHWYLAFTADPDPAHDGLLDAYRQYCDTLGRTVRVELPAGHLLTGTAANVDEEGRLVVRDTGTGALVPVAAGDVIHVRC